MAKVEFFLRAKMVNILVIEDEAELREILVGELEDSGYKTSQARNGKEGLQKILSERPDLILSDIHMPEMTGHQLRGYLNKNHPEHAKIPFVFLTALADRADVEDGLLLRVDHYLTKPVNFDQLQGWVKDLSKRN